MSTDRVDKAWQRKGLKDYSTDVLDGPPIEDFFFVARNRMVFVGVRSADPTRAGELVKVIRNLGDKLPGTFLMANQVSVFEQGLAAGRTIDPGWHEVGGFLGGSIREFWRRYPLERQLELWRAAGVEDVKHHRLSLGGGIVIWGRRGGG